MSTPSCPNCHVSMEEGFLPDRGHANFLSQEEWVEGQPEKSVWFGLWIRGHERFPTVTYRCPTCGLLQSYAHAPQA